MSERRDTVTAVDSLFRNMGQMADRAWLQAHRNEAALPAIAQDTFEAFNPEEHLTLKNVAEWLCARSSLDPQLDVSLSFGQPPITVFSANNLFIELYVWRDFDVGMHNHAFFGAFRIIHGNSIHAEYDFSETRVVNSRFRLGQIQRKKVSLFKPGDGGKFQCAPSLIHRLIHVDRPSLSMVIRTRDSSSDYFSYLPPGVALGLPGALPDLVRRQLEMLRRVDEVDHIAFVELLRGMVESLDANVAFTVLRELQERLSFEELELVLSFPRLDEIRGPMMEALEQDEFTKGLMVIRRHLEHEQDRFFVTTLMVCESRESILQLISARFPGLDASTVLRTCLKRTASRMSELGVEASGVSLDDSVIEGLLELLEPTSDSKPGEQVLAASEGVFGPLFTSQSP